MSDSMEQLDIALMELDVAREIISLVDRDNAPPAGRASRLRAAQGWAQAAVKRIDAVLEAGE